MDRRVEQTIVVVVVAIVLIIGVAPALAAPAGAATSLSLSSPTGDARRAAPPASGDELTVSWTIDAPVSSGYFCVYLYNSRSEKAEGAWQQSVVKGATAYSRR